MHEKAVRKSWFARHWFWVVPVGCLSVLALVAAFVGAILLVVFGAMRSSDAYGIAMERAEQSDEVVAALGEPIEAGWLVSGNIQVNGPSGDANLSVPLSGPSGEGTLYVVAEKKAGQWHFDTMEVEVVGAAARIDLLAVTSESPRE